VKVAALAPRSTEEAAQIVRDAARARDVVLARGFGSKSGWAAAPKRVDVEVSTLALRGITAHEPGDGVISALAGTPWIELERAARARGHHVSPWIAGAERATVGGVVSAGASGADRLRYGPLRHHVLGLAWIDGEGRVARSGGRLVKNVTGFDVHRLLVGAHGTLGLVVEASFRLHAAPAARAAGAGEAATRGPALELARALLGAARCAWSVRVLAPERAGEPWTIRALAGGMRAALEQDVRAGRARAPAVEWAIEEAGSDPETPVARAFAAAREVGPAGGAGPTLRATCLPAALDGVLAEFDRASAESGLRARLVLDPGLAVLEAHVAEPGASASAPIGSAQIDSAQFDLAQIGSARIDSAQIAAPHVAAALTRAGARVRWFGPHGAHTAAPVPAASALMRRLQEALDPRGVFPRGRLAGGL
jgi:glycolate oxidase FAD binding subunit